MTLCSRKLSWVRAYSPADQEAATSLDQVISELKDMESFTKYSTLQRRNEAWERFTGIAQVWFLQRPTVGIRPLILNLPPTPPSSPSSRLPTDLDLCTRGAGCAADADGERGHTFEE